MHYMNGITAEDPVRGMRLHIIEVDPSGSRMQLEYWSLAGAPPETKAHVHEHWTERFDVLAGSACYRVGGDVRTVEAGSSFVLPAGRGHLHPWNTGRDELHVRQTSEVSPPNLRAIEDTIAGFLTMYRLAAEGRTDPRTGRPDPLQMAVILRRFQKHGHFLEGAPRVVQRLLFGTLAVVGSLSGRRIDTIDARAPERAAART